MFAVCASVCVRLCVWVGMAGSGFECVCVARLSSLSDAGPMQCLYLAVGAGAVLA